MFVSVRTGNAERKAFSLFFIWEFFISVGFAEFFSLFLISSETRRVPRRFPRLLYRVFASTVPVFVVFRFGRERDRSGRDSSICSLFLAVRQRDNETKQGQKKGQDKKTPADSAKSRCASNGAAPDVADTPLPQ